MPSERRDYFADVPDHEPMHLWFNLTYSSYLVMQRTLIQSMPNEWQRRLYALLNEMEHAVGHHRVGADEFTVNAREGRRFVKDPLCNYERGRRRVSWADDYVPAPDPLPRRPSGE